MVHNGVDVSKLQRAEFIESAASLRNRLGIPNDVTVFSCIASFRPEKGHHLLIQAFAETPPHSHLVLAGDGERRSAIEAAVTAAGLRDRVIFLGNVVDVRPIIVASTATILASTAETFSLAMLESMALGVPVIAPRIGGLPEAIIPGETGMLFGVGDYRELALHMNALAGDADKVAAMGLAAQALVANRFDSEGMLHKAEAVLKDVAIC